MIRLIEALNFRCLRHISQPLKDFQVLVGPNASGKTTFLDVVAFLSDLLKGGLEYAVNERTSTFSDLLWGRSGERFELAVELDIPEERKDQLQGEFSLVRYEMALGLERELISILDERVLLKKEIDVRSGPQPREIFPQDSPCPQTVLGPKSKTGNQAVATRGTEGNANFYSEVREGKGKGWVPSFKLGPQSSALANLPADETRFPVATWLRDFLTDGVQRLVLNSLLIRKASPPGQGKRFKPDGSNLPWVIEDLRKSDPVQFEDWIKHLQTALPEIRGIRTVERQDDLHRYLVVKQEGGLEVPSWLVSDGTLRLLALTLPAYLPSFSGVYLIEEPENGIHPQAVETMFQALSSVYGAQILLATHSPVVLSIAEPAQVLCFSRTATGATDIVEGERHPALRDWKGEENLGVLFAGGVLS